MRRRNDCTTFETARDVLFECLFGFDISTSRYYNTVNKCILITTNKHIHIISAYFLAAASNKHMRLLTSLYGIILCLTLFCWSGCFPADSRTCTVDVLTLNTIFSFDPHCVGQSVTREWVSITKLKLSPLEFMSPFPAVWKCWHQLPAHSKSSINRSSWNWQHPCDQSTSDASIWGCG